MILGISHDMDNDFNVSSVRDSFSYSMRGLGSSIHVFVAFFNQVSLVLCKWKPFVLLG